MTPISNHQPYPQHLSHQPYPQHIKPTIKKTTEVKHGNPLSPMLFRIYINIWMPLHSTNFASIKFWVAPLYSKMDTCCPCTVLLIVKIQNWDFPCQNFNSRLTMHWKAINTILGHKKWIIDTIRNTIHKLSFISQGI